MLYRVFADRAIISERADIVCDKDFPLHFEEIQDGMSIIFKGKGYEVYRKTKDNSCVLEARYLTDGEIKVAIADSKFSKIIHGESLFVRTINGKKVISPADNDMFARLLSLEIQNEELKLSLSEITKELQRQKEKIESLIDGYDIT